MTVLAIIMAIEDEQDRAFVEEVYAAYADKMYRIAYDVVGNHHDAQDCVQETIVKIIDRVDRFREAKDRDYLKKLIVIACRNVAINKYNENRKRAREEVSTTVYGEDDSYSIMDIPDQSADVARIVLSDDNCRYLKELIDRLDHCYRDVLVLRGLGLDHGEIADLMGISVELVRKRYQRARQKLLEMGGEALYGCRNA
jgi:RNA polymerase sigma-70 factor (ECF subfamily)